MPDLVRGTGFEESYSRIGSAAKDTAGEIDEMVRRLAEMNRLIAKLRRDMRADGASSSEINDVVNPLSDTRDDFARELASRRKYAAHLQNLLEIIEDKARRDDKAQKAEGKHDSHVGIWKHQEEERKRQDREEREHSRQLLQLERQRAAVIRQGMAQFWGAVGQARGVAAAGAPTALSTLDKSFELVKAQLAAGLVPVIALVITKLQDFAGWLGGASQQSYMGNLFKFGSGAREGATWGQGMAEAGGRIGLGAAAGGKMGGPLGALIGGAAAGTMEVASLGTSLFDELARLREEGDIGRRLDKQVEELQRRLAEGGTGTGGVVKGRPGEYAIGDDGQIVRKDGGQIGDGGGKRKPYLADNPPGYQASYASFVDSRRMMQLDALNISPLDMELRKKQIEMHQKLIEALESNTRAQPSGRTVPGNERF